MREIHADARPFASRIDEITADSRMGDVVELWEVLDAAVEAAKRSLANDLIAKGHERRVEPAGAGAAALSPDHIAKDVEDGVIRPDDELLRRLGVVDAATRVNDLAVQRERLYDKCPLIRYCKVTPPAAAPNRDAIVAPDLETAADRVARLVGELEAVRVVATVAAGTEQLGLLELVRSRIRVATSLIVLADVKAALAKLAVEGAGLRPNARSAAMEFVDATATRGELAFYSATNASSEDRGALLALGWPVLWVKVEGPLSHVKDGPARGLWTAVHHLTPDALRAEGPAHVVVVRIAPDARP